MRLLVTGMNGTIAPRLAAHAERAGHDVIAWDRASVSPDDPVACLAFLDRTRPDGIAHLAFGAESWAGLLAQQALDRGIPMVFTSTSMVFAQRPDGPYAVDTPRTADTEYGQYKVRCENAVLAASPAAMVARLAYQLDPDGRGNNLVAHLDAEAAGADGVVIGQAQWVPAMAFLDDTAAALLGLLEAPAPGVHHLDGNAEPAWSHLRIVTALAHALGRDWRITASDELVHDQRLLDSARIAQLDARLV